MALLTARPTPVARKVYIKFGNKCRSNGEDIKIVLTKLMTLYTKKGDKVFLE